jgi:ABC-type Mn2+/Zn2+ transport system ATPase subunit
MSTNKALTIENISVSLNHQLVLSDVHISWDLGACVGIIGPNGGGKTTLLKTIVGLIKPQSGTISFFGESFNAWRHKVSYVPQRSAVEWDFPVTVYDVVMMGRYVHLGWFSYPSLHDKEQVNSAIEKVGLSDYRDRPIGALSGGQQQRVFLARALAQDPTIFLLDEPFAAVDVTSEKIIMDVLLALRHQQKLVVMVHHDLEAVLHHCDSATLVHKTRALSGRPHEILSSSVCNEVFRFSTRSDKQMSW